MLGLCVVLCPFVALFAPFPFGAVREDALCSGRPLFLRVREGGAACMEGLPRIPEGRGGGGGAGGPAALGVHFLEEKDV